MSDSTPGPDEIAVRDHLHDLLDGLAPTEPVQPERPRDWLDDILDSPPEPETQPAAADPKPEPRPVTKPRPKAKPKTKTRRKKQRKKRRTRHPVWDASPRQSLLDAFDNVPARLKWLAYHAGAAYLGWSAGLVGYATYVTAWIARTGLLGPQACFWYCAGAATFWLYRRTRRWWWPAAWLAAVPASSVVVGVLLYGTPHL